MAYLSIKTNINKLVFTAHAVPHGDNCYNHIYFIHFFNHIQTDSCENIFRVLFINIFMHFFVRLLCLFKHFDVIYDSVVHAIKQNSDNLCDFFSVGSVSSFSVNRISTRAVSLIAPKKPRSNHGASRRGRSQLLCGRLMKN